ncbi:MULTISPECIES: ABC transporter ATP-binding protein [unclassified Bradyrhizobium]|uniref:ABC transporter ATP-binding protein n=1 Tax=unclassified Bradyrhizobium TaxID=2631580 RepID=UPI001CD5A29A|nr:MULTISPECIES: ABC transporter ATP-binding protein [unclassified Bradyrhizobium]MCA1498914.1 ABC transporter ATP-binding protein [Bradyrhizobium sp. NBAIM14]MCA1513811.1 ABC transporter ATP-binding protein [Bradyrhizobium sp. NBAIM01]MCA1535282.1 ABC transporter ATP-binding protein [Bradyrhizobium sp. NBAIM03]
MSTPLLSVENLSITLNRRGTPVPLVRNVSFAIDRGETLCLVGESGCGKSLTALSIIGLLNRSVMQVASGRILFEGRDLVTLGAEELRKLRGDRLAMVFQEPMTSLNPLLRVGEQIAEVIVEHRGVSEADARRQAVGLLDLVRIPDARRRASEFPHQLSGGMRQRVMIAMALALRPALLIADEPTTALDVTIQAQVLTLIDDLRREFGTSVLLITHDLGVVAEMADRVVVLYAGSIVEQAGVNGIFDAAAHPYTRGLLGAIGQLNSGIRDRLVEIPGSVPSPVSLGTGCAFRQRCGAAMPVCHSEPPLLSGADEHLTACWLGKAGAMVPA